MNKRILVGVDMELSPPTQQALQVVSEFLEPTSLSLQVVLLTVIPILDTSYTRGTRVFPLEMCLLPDQTLSGDESHRPFAAERGYTAELYSSLLSLQRVETERVCCYQEVPGPLPTAFTKPR